ncbi:hypothetical protein LZF95_03000 [Algoriphagus sp. AGSA1]|uniref:hypothetical protein n=1 Tax=Algoriphagus sp. AGSA1 TaxID=2907213 RepID=UPI001F1F581B|nr:hypothetical protein [Algoriphagus sp. AGSA1]MCE7053631.1 hypothetical protein [Algoriphagus sp. AGSA1]
MKYVLTLVLVLAAFATFGQSNPIDGKWKGTRETPNGSIEIEYTFKVEGTILTGSWKTQFGEAKLNEGKVDGEKFSYSISFNEMTINNSGELVNENEIVVKNERGEMTLTRIKE